MDSQVSRSSPPVPSTRISFERGLLPLLLFLVSTSLLATIVPLYIYPNLSRYAALIAMGGAFFLIGVAAWLALRSEGLRIEDIGLGRADILPGVLIVVMVYLFINGVAAVLAFIQTGSVRFGISGDVSTSGWLAMAPPPSSSYCSSV